MSTYTTRSSAVSRGLWPPPSPNICTSKQTLQHLPVSPSVYDTNTKHISECEESFTTTLSPYCVRNSVSSTPYVHESPRRENTSHKSLFPLYMLGSYGKGKERKYLTTETSFKSSLRSLFVWCKYKNEHTGDGLQVPVTGFPLIRCWTVGGLRRVFIAGFILVNAQCPICRRALCLYSYTPTC